MYLLVSLIVMLYVTITIVLKQIDYRAVQKLSGSDDVLKGPFANETKDVRGSEDTGHSFVLGDLVSKTTYEVHLSAESIVGVGEPAVNLFETLGDENGQSRKSKFSYMYSNLVYESSPHHLSPVTTFTINSVLNTFKLY